MSLVGSLARPSSLAPRSRALAILGLAFVLAGAGPAPPAPAPISPSNPPISRGTIVENIAAVTDPSQTYALYVPTTYDPARRWPIVYLLDARGRAMVPAERFRAAAETYGYILASSYNSASDGPFAPNLKAMQAMWSDTHRRFAIDEKRTYAAGFSGTARASCTLALAVPGSIVGVIGAGAGFPPAQPPTAKTPFIFFGTVGNLDFNFDEMQDLDDTLADLHLAHRIEEFSGPHQWMPAELATLSIEWLEIQAMKAGTRRRDAALLQTLWQGDLDQARRLEAGGDRLAAWHRYRAIAEEFAELVDVAPASTKAAELAAAKDVKARQRERRELRERDRQYIADAQRTLSAVDPEAGPINLPRLFAELRIPDLKARAAKDPAGVQAQSAQRVLNTFGAQTGFYLPQLYIGRKDYRRAELMYTVAAEIYPQRPSVWYNLAAMRSRNGARKQALESLKHAIALGFKDAETLEKDGDFAGLRGEPEFREALAGLRRTAPAGSG